jgi:formamidopyrimidine-DNA glycosylase
MPELPEVETVRRGLAPAMVGKRIRRVEQRRADLRFPFPERFVARLTGKRVKALGRRAKYLLAALDSGETLIMHLGMSGSFRIVTEAEATPGAFHVPRGKLAAHDHVVLHFDDARIVYNDPRRFGFMALAETTALDKHPLLANVGLEPLGEAFTPAALAALLAGARAPLKSALLDQTRIAGLGNIYVCEALHAARLSPFMAAGDVGPAGVNALVKAIRATLASAIEAGGSTLRDHRRADGELGYFQHSFAVYDREGAPCPRRGCGGHIVRSVQSGRSTFSCDRCQAARTSQRA